ncbi:MAG: DNA-processing protein DprA [Nitrospirota bacterium]|nr:DNA-processing protein DprA [Nitrospirota bacterium]
MTEDPEKTLSWIGLISVPGVGRTTFRKLVSLFGSPRAALGASASDLRESGVSERLAGIIAGHSWREHAERELEMARAAGVSVVTDDDPSYPAGLRGTSDSPVFLYIRGNIAAADDQALAIVGTRTPTPYGTTVAGRMARELARAGITIVSGMARGIDTQAHLGALAAKGRTIAVLGCGIDVAYPPENRELMERIAASGAVVTENPFGTPPESGYFPARNRIISGLSRGTVIIEATEDSGSLITADYAVKQGRTLFAVPGNVGSPTSRGPNSLIKKGAVLVEHAGDILSRIGRPDAVPAADRSRPLPEMSEDERRTFLALGMEAKHIDQVASETGGNASRTGSMLTLLELKGLVKQLPGKYFVRDSE